MIKRVILVLMTVLLIKSEESSEDQKEKPKMCNKPLMRMYLLDGYEKPKYNQSIPICGNVKDNCCSLFDQMLIVKLWRDHSLPSITHKVHMVSRFY